MDQPPASPDAQNRPAPSPDPAPTRLNPFDDDANSARKRRRTSPVGSSSSLMSDSIMDQTDDSPPADPAAMNIDQSTSNPTTPDHSSGVPPPELTHQRSASRVTTINLRHHGTLDSAASPATTTTTTTTTATTSSSSTSSSCEPATNGQPRLVPDDSHMSDAQPSMMERDSFESGDGASPASSTIATSSPRLDGVEEAGTSVTTAALDDPGFAVVGEQPAFDFARDFPYRNDTQHEALFDAVDRIFQYLDSSDMTGADDEGVLAQLLRWMTPCAGYFRRMDMERRIACFSGQLPFWRKLRDVIVHISRKRPRYPFGSPQRLAANTILRATGDVAAVLVQADLDNLAGQRDAPGSTDAAPHLMCRFMLDAFGVSLRMHATKEPPYSTAHEDAELARRFLDAESGGLNNLLRLAQTQVALLPRHPQVVNNLDFPSGVLACVLGSIKTMLPEHLLTTQQWPGATKARLALGLQYFDVVSAALSTAIDKHVTQLIPCHAEKLVCSLGDTLAHGLVAGHEAATQRLAHLRKQFPEVPDQDLVQMAAWEWRLGVLFRLIKSSQMQLRVMALRKTCDDLVYMWKINKENCDTPLMNTLALHLDGLGIVDYVLDPTCHPELTAHSGNVVGFLLVTDQYRADHTDLLWRRITCVEDARNYESLAHFANAVFPMFSTAGLRYLLSKYRDVPMADMSPIMVTVLNLALHHYLQVLPHDHESVSSLVELLLRLVRETWLLRPDATPANPEFHNIAMERLRDVLADEKHAEIRATVLASCCADITSKSPTTLGSMSCLLRLGPPSTVDLRKLMATYGFPRIIIEEIEHAAQHAPQRGLSTILQLAGNGPRVQFLAYIIRQEAKTITDDLSMRLLDVLVGPRAISQGDREAAWRMLNKIGNESGYNNPFLHACFVQYLSDLAASHFNSGTLDFVSGIMLRKLDASNYGPSAEQPCVPEDNALDGGDNMVQIGIEHLWRIILSTENQALAERLIRTLVDDVYVGSRVIQSYPYRRARQVHRDLVGRCLAQMADAAEQLRQDDQDEDLVSKRTFARSLSVLQAFLAAYQAHKVFPAPDLRPMMLQAPESIRGELACLKFQSADGEASTSMASLNIGFQNSLASLLATLRDATGFQNFRAYYSGGLFRPKRRDLAKSLEDLGLTCGLFLIIKEEPNVPTPAKTAAGTSALEIEVLHHFPQLWSYLNMKGALASQIYQVLTSLPADARMLATIEAATSTHRDIFPYREPYKCLYAVYALDKYLQTALWPIDGEWDAQAKTTVFLRTRTLVADALADSDLLEGCDEMLPKHQLSSALMRLYLYTFQCVLQHGDDDMGVSGTLPVDRLVVLLDIGLQHPRVGRCLDFVRGTFDTLLLTATLNSACWAEFHEHPRTEGLIRDILLEEKDHLIRRPARAVIFERCGMNFGAQLAAQAPAVGGGDRVALTAALRQFFWRVLSPMVPDALKLEQQAIDFFDVVHGLAKHLMAVHSSDVLDVCSLARQLCIVLQTYETSEVLGIAHTEDAILFHMLSMLALCFQTQDETVIASFNIPERFAENMFWQYLFPRDRKCRGDGVSPVVLSGRVRQLIYQILQTVSSRSETSTSELVRALTDLTPFDKRDDECGYSYEMAWNIERASELRADCGYAGLRNLSNTCYMNSLLTQLFMNTGFRDFMVKAPVHDQRQQELLSETQKVFSYLQESQRRFVDPEHFFLSIRAPPDNGSLDASVQMDVDEFYNLLFDRWESQMPDAKNRQTFRSFFGGQLVQQVSSKECEHISERLEPFSAIQCEVRGQRNLAASLQAYVDGEVLSGENKYKCSECDQHVDAVKRACLKDIPDNLIFHLKRFDFNLRTMMRSKINDHFAFPAKIDMRPYTVEYLSDPTQELPEDMFELVGVLVHTGTAETGHYYSYIRERPSTQDSQTWLEFNDDSVTFWDPANMEDATFGALPQMREHSGFSFEKSNNAYMLFYQRSSVLKAQQEVVAANEMTMPLKVDLPYEILEAVMNDNTTCLRRHCLYDENHLQFTLNFCESILTPAGGNGVNEHLERRAVDILLATFDQAVTRTRSLSFVNPYGLALERAVQRSKDSAVALIQYFSETQEPFRQLVQRNPDAEIRNMAGCLFLKALRTIRAADPNVYGLNDDLEHDSRIAGGSVDLFEVLWLQFHLNMRAWPEVFGLITQFALMGDFEVALLLQRDWLSRAMMVVATDSAFGRLPEKFRRLNTVLLRRRESRSRPPDYANVIELIARLMTGLSDTIDDRCMEAADRSEEYFVGSHKKLPWSGEELDAISGCDEIGSVFIRRLLEVGGDVPATQAIIGFMATGDSSMQEYVLDVLSRVLQHHAGLYSIRSFVFAAQTFVLAHPDATASGELMELVARACVKPGPDGGAFLHFFRAVHSVLEKEQNVRVPKEVLYLVPWWGPALLGDPNRHVAHAAEVYIKSDVLPLDRDEFAEEEDRQQQQQQQQVEEPMAEYARVLAKRCLEYLGREFLGRANTAESMAHLQSVVAHCEHFFVDPEPGSQENLSMARDELYTRLQFNLVEELDEEGSGTSPVSDLSDSTVDI